ncbi:4-hydroxy-3-methylbut-2-enyl diphosphate reductase, partial [Francisella tularensis]|nr:4-hydroxy-3-methylbut-2-enyl diphosphate reductase [Francisella tularensis]
KGVFCFIEVDEVIDNWILIVGAIVLYLSVKAAAAKNNLVLSVSACPLVTKVL